MTEEYLDIVDNNGNLTGKRATRSQAHTDGLWHRTVHIFLYKYENGKLYFLTQQRSKYKDRHPNEWTMVSGGHVVAGSTIEDAVKAELFEELGINAEKLKLISAGVHKYESQVVNNKEFVHLFFSEFDGSLDDLNFNDGEVQSAKWREATEIELGIKNEPANWADKLESHKRQIELFKKYVA